MLRFVPGRLFAGGGRISGDCFGNATRLGQHGPQRRLMDRPTTLAVRLVQGKTPQPDPALAYTNTSSSRSLPWPGRLTAGTCPELTAGSGRGNTVALQKFRDTQAYLAPQFTGSVALAVQRMESLRVEGPP